MHYTSKGLLTLLQLFKQQCGNYLVQTGVGVGGMYAGGYFKHLTTLKWLLRVPPSLLLEKYIEPNTMYVGVL